jgi:metallo-beta-lactamase family protein
LKLQFLGAAQTVTGSKTLISFSDKKFLVDCGLFQGPKEKRILNWEPFAHAKDISGVILTHAHIDHSGYIPKLVKEGFRGPIYCSQGTEDLCKIMLCDAGHLQEEDARFANRSGYSNHKPALPLFDEADAVESLKYFKAVERDVWHELIPGVSFRLLRSGHIIGSSFIQFSVETSNGSRIVTFSGDLGNGRLQTLKPPVSILESDYLILEGTYGDRVQSKTDPGPQLAEIINRVYSRGGVLVIPAFSVGRSQEILYLIRKLEDAGKIPKHPVYLDSPMANHATDIYLNHPEDHQLVLRNGELESPICTSSYFPVKSADESMLLCMKNGPMIVISAAGMLTGGRILHHLKHRISDSKNAVLFVGYQAEGTKGQLLQKGLADIRIHHETFSVEAEICTIDSLSAHADVDDIIAWLKGFKRPPKKILLNHGEPLALESLKNRIESELKFNVTIPKSNEVFNFSDDLIYRERVG